MSAAALCHAAREGRALQVDATTIRRACEAAGPGRRPWTVWGEWSYTDLSDRRFGGRREGASHSYTLGMDRALDRRTVAGVALEYSDADYSAFNGGMTQQIDGLALKPYVVRQLGSTPVFLDASVTFGFLDYRQDILVLSGSHDAFALSASIGVSSVQVQSGFVIRPRLSVSYGRMWHDGFDFEGELIGRRLRVPQPNSGFDLGAAAAALEISRPFRTDGGWVVSPYVELEAQFAFERPNDGRVLTGRLDLASTSSVSGAVRFGVRTRVTPDTNLVAAGAYNGLGVRNLSIWEWRLYLSKRF